MIKRVKQLFCWHQWPPIYFAVDEYKKEYKCQKCGKIKMIYVGDKPEYINVLPTDYYQRRNNDNDQS